jgi:CRP/FNR family transcriptional regulator, cyclic AMP receptor protein
MTVTFLIFVCCRVSTGGQRTTSESSPVKNSVILHLPSVLSAQLFRVATRRRLQSGRALFVAGDPGDGCYRLEQGVLKVVITSPWGKERILSMLGPGEIVGELSTIDGQPRSSSIFAVRDCTLSFISRKDFVECTKQHPEIYQYLANVLAARLRETNAEVAADSFLTVKERLARILIELGELLGEADKAGRVVIRHKIKLNDLAAMAGVARENVSRVMSDWKRRKVVTRSEGYYCLDAGATLKRDLKAGRKANLEFATRTPTEISVQ